MIHLTHDRDPFPPLPGAYMTNQWLRRLYAQKDVCNIVAKFLRVFEVRRGREISDKNTIYSHSKICKICCQQNMCRYLCWLDNCQKDIAHIVQKKKNYIQKQVIEVTL